MEVLRNLFAIFGTKKFLKQLVLLYLGIRVLRFLHWRRKSGKNFEKGQRVYQQKLSTHFNFKESRHPQHSILSLDIKQTRAALLEGTFTVTELVTLYCQRCYTIGRRLNLSADEMFGQALKTAAEYDKRLEEARDNGTLNELPELFGIPFSVKDQIELKGTRATVGFSYLSDNISTETNPYIQEFINKGAIPIVKGNVPQGVVSIFTMNNVYGTAKNPFDEKRTVGGSTGGDAALIAAQCSMFALGTDIGGSIRTPAHFNGIYGFKMTSERVSRTQIKSSMPRSTIYYPYILTAIGPLTSSMDNLLTLSKVILNTDINAHDPTVANTPFSQKLYREAKSSTLKIGYIDNWELVPTSKAQKRAVTIARQALEEQGYELVPFRLSKQEQKEMSNVFLDHLGGLSQSLLFQNMEENYEPAAQNLATNQLLYSRSRLFQKIIIALGYLLGHHRIAHKISSLRKHSKAEVEDMIYRRHLFVNKIKDKWRQLGISAIVAPPYLSCAFTLKNGFFVSNMVDYAALWNIMNFPGGVVPITEVLPGEENCYEDEYNDFVTKMIKEDQVGSVGMPVGVQVVSWGFKDEVSLAVMKAIDEKVQFKKIPLC